MSIFEIIMLVCFGAAWPMSIYKSWVSRSTGGKSVVFLFIVASGYLSGVMYKVTGRLDWVICLYSLNFLMVAFDIGLYFRNRAIEKMSLQQL